MTSRNDIFEALFDLVSTGEGLPSRLTWGPDEGDRAAWTSRRVRMFDNLPAKPALCQIEPDENLIKVPKGLPYKRIYGAEWWVFHNQGADDAAIPTILNNDICDAIEAILAPRPFETSDRQTLGGLVHDVYIEGQIMKVSGDIVGEALICVPLKILVP